MRNKPTLCLDFDGVIHPYRTGWQGVANINMDERPVYGTHEFLFEATKHFRVAIYSSRSSSFRGRWAMQRYMKAYFATPLTFSSDHTQDFLHEEFSWPWFKPSALVSIDDRAITFDGTWPSVSALLMFKPWNKR